MNYRPLVLVTSAVLASAVLANCSSDPAATTSDSDVVTIYSGRSESLVGQALANAAEKTGTKIEVRYGDSAELSAQLLEEGDQTKADLFFSSDAGALGALAAQDRLATLDDDLVKTVNSAYVDDQKRWVATSARARVLVYSPEAAPEVAHMKSIDDLLKPEYEGKVGIAPTNASFQAFVTALRLQRGEEGAQEFLTKLKANKPKIYEKNGAILDAVDKGEVPIGLINHYYWYEKGAEKGGTDKLSAKLQFLAAGDPGALVNVAGVGILKASPQASGAAALVAELLSPQMQEEQTQKSYEYPVVSGVKVPAGLPALDSITSKDAVDLNKLESFPATLELLNKVGLT